MQFYKSQCAMNVTSCNKHYPGGQIQQAGEHLALEQEFQLLETGLGSLQQQQCPDLISCALGRLHLSQKPWGFSSAGCMTHILWQSSTEYSCHCVQMSKPAQKVLLYKTCNA